MSFNTSFFKTQVRNQTLQLRVLKLQFLQPSSLVHLQTTVLPAPTVISLFHDRGFLAGLRQRLAVRHANLNLPQQVHNLLCRMPCLEPSKAPLNTTYYRS